MAKSVRQRPQPPDPRSHLHRTSATSPPWCAWQRAGVYGGRATRAAIARDKTPAARHNGGRAGSYQARTPPVYESNAMARPLEDMQAHFADAEREGVLLQIAETGEATYCAGPGHPTVVVHSAAEFDAARPKRSGKRRPS